jgi:uncharacterized phage-associated protein
MKTVDIAKDIIHFCKINNVSFDATKIQKLLYIFVGYALINNVAVDEDRIVDEAPQAFPYGPVFKKVYDSYTSIANSVGENYKPSVSGIAADILKKTVIPQWGKYTSKQLSDWSHAPGSPWYYVINGRKTGWQSPIDFYLIKPYFEQLIKQ